MQFLFLKNDRTRKTLVLQFDPSIAQRNGLLNCRGLLLHLLRDRAPGRQRKRKQTVGGRVSTNLGSVQKERKQADSRVFHCTQVRVGDSESHNVKMDAAPLHLSRGSRVFSAGGKRGLVLTPNIRYPGAASEIYRNS